MLWLSYRLWRFGPLLSYCRRYQRWCFTVTCHMRSKLTVHAMIVSFATVIRIVTHRFSPSQVLRDDPNNDRGGDHFSYNVRTNVMWRRCCWWLQWRCWWHHENNGFVDDVTDDISGRHDDGDIENYDDNNKVVTALVKRTTLIIPFFPSSRVAS